MAAKLDERELEQALAHVDRCWRAEEQNASRLATRSNLVLSGILAVIGLKLFTANPEIEVMSKHASVAGRHLFWFLTISAMLGLFYALWNVLEVSLNGGSSPASAKMTLRDVRTTLDDGSENTGRFVLACTYEAAVDLHVRNIKRSKAVAKAQGVFFLSAILILVAVVQYVVVAYAAVRGE